ncbi:MAG TPA: PHP domain-containing protein, partial [Feifaniaceae bacterium]|nr:PHP domain-containing protein [Feifaniaceae bacterium]
PAEGYDYIIGALHYLHVNGKYHTLDNSHEQMRACIDEGFGGDALGMARAYYDILVSYVTTDKVDIAGHFDVIQKRNGDNRYFDAQSPKYRRIALDAIEAIANAGKIIEVNTGAIARGFLLDPYPAPFLLKRLLELKAPIILSSDAHAAEQLDAQFDTVSAMLYEMGFRETMELKRGHGFVPVPLQI